MALFAVVAVGLLALLLLALLAWGMARHLGDTLTEHDAGVYHGTAADAFKGEVFRLTGETFDA